MTRQHWPSLRSEKGFAVLIAIIIALVIATLTASLHSYLQPLTQNQLRLKAQFETMIAIEDLSQILKRGYIEGQAGSCLSGQTMTTIGSLSFCLPPQPCVHVSSSSQEICLEVTTQGIQVVLSNPWYKDLKDALLAFWTVHWLTANVAEAQGVELYRPTLASPPQSSVASVTCPTDGLCQNCGAGNNAVCIKFAICPPGSDCAADPSQYLRQAVRFSTLP